jgi:hypothetical protein
MKNSIECNTKTEIEKISIAYLIAKQAVIENGYEYEIDWQISTKYSQLTETIFLQEAAWVILSAGMRERVIRSVFPYISSAFFDWTSASIITSNGHNCRANALIKFRHEKKIDAIIEIASHVAERSFDFVYDSIQHKGIQYLSNFPFLGPATSCHLAKNLGIPIAKPDRHLIRIANVFGYTNVQDLCIRIAEYVGDEVAEIDLVLWRYATLDKNYLNTLKQNSIL